MSTRATILGIPIDAISRPQAQALAERMLDEPHRHLITTPNPEMAVLAHRDTRFRNILRRADLAIPDGTGIVWAMRRAGFAKVERIAGVDFLDDLCAIAVEKRAGVYFLGAKEGIAQEAAEVLRRRHPSLIISGATSGGDIAEADGKDDAAGWREDPKTVDSIIDAAPRILVVALGHGKQEKWIADHLPSLPSVRIAIGVGGAFDVIADRIPRAPRWVRRLGLEWLFRLILEPRRIARIWNAVVVFSWLVMTKGA